MAFLCLFSALVICNLLTPIASPTQEVGLEKLTSRWSFEYIGDNGTQPDGDGDGGDPVGGGWPK